MDRLGCQICFLIIHVDKTATWCEMLLQEIVGVGIVIKPDFFHWIV
jgi:hypothetical protein